MQQSVVLSYLFHSPKCNTAPRVKQLKHSKVFGYGESNPELPRALVESATENFGIPSCRFKVKGGNVSRYTISDISLFDFQNIYILFVAFTPTTPIHLGVDSAQIDQKDI